MDLGKGAQPSPGPPEKLFVKMCVCVYVHMHFSREVFWSLSGSQRVVLTKLFSTAPKDFSPLEAEAEGLHGSGKGKPRGL